MVKIMALVSWPPLYSKKNIYHALLYIQMNLPNVFIDMNVFLCNSPIGTKRCLFPFPVTLIKPPS
jgi:hypothetical protein